MYTHPNTHTERERDIFLLDHTQIPTVAVAGLDQSPELRTQSSSPKWVAGTQILQPLFVVSQGAH